MTPSSDQTRKEAEEWLTHFRESANPRTAEERWAYLDEAAMYVERLLSMPALEASEDVQQLHDFLTLYVPAGFCDDDGVWHDGPHRNTALKTLDRLASSLSALEAERDVTDAVLSRWFAHYPEDVFLPLTVEQVADAVKAIAETGITSDALHAAWARHLLHHVMREIVEARAALASAGSREENK